MKYEQNEEKLLNVRETAKLLGVHENTVRNWVKTGVLNSSRLPGASSHRFSIEEVMRLKRSKGKLVASLAPTMKTSGPELITGHELNTWASRDDSKGTFPELMRRLLAQTPGISNLDIRAHEGGAAEWWDGTATSLGSSFLPAGELRFEFSTESNPKSKADRDFRNRRPNSPADKKNIFVFATPRSWPGAKKWAAERASEKKFAGVKAIDAHVLEGWLQSVVPVHYWISERLGFRPRGVRSLENWWGEFQNRTTIRLPADFFVAGRTQELNSLVGFLTGDSGTDFLAMQAPWIDEVLAFIYASLESRDELLERCLVVTDPDVWDRIIETSVPLILIPVFNSELNIEPAIKSGHLVILVADSENFIQSKERLLLPKIDRLIAGESLKSLEQNSSQIDEIIALARRSMSALFRQYSRNPVMRSPKWATEPEILGTIAPLISISSWTSASGDLSVIQRITGRSSDEVLRTVVSLLGRADAPFVNSGGIWKITSPWEAAHLLIPKLTNGNLAKWEEIATEVLLSPDPFIGMDSLSTLKATEAGIKREYSETLTKSIAKSLALAGASDELVAEGTPVKNVVDRIVRRVLTEANKDDSGKIWQSLSYVLPELAEASPEVFQDAVEENLANPHQTLRYMFQDQMTESPLNISSPHSGLLWSLETLCWSPMFFGSAFNLLSQIAAIDPGGRLSNRPLASLKNICLGWIQLSGADTNDKLKVIKNLLQRNPEIGWKLTMSVWPGHDSVAFPPHKPTFRDWTPSHVEVSIADWTRYVHELMILAIAAAGEDANSWVQLLEKLYVLPNNDREELLAQFERILTSNSWNSEAQYSVWEMITSEASRHEKYSKSPWAMPAADVSTLQRLALKIAPIKDARRFSNLFDWSSQIPYVEDDLPTDESSLKKLQIEAIEQVLSQEKSELVSLVDNVKMPATIGILLAEIDDVPEGIIFEWLTSDSIKLKQASFGYIRSKSINKGFEWILDVLNSSELQITNRRLALMSALPFSREFWTEVDQLDSELVAAYWKEARPFSTNLDESIEAIHLLVAHDRAWQAIALLNFALHGLETDLCNEVKSVLNALINTNESIEDPSMAGYYIEEAIKYLEKFAPDDPDLASFEFTFFEFLHDHEPTTALYKALSTNPEEFVNLVCVLFRGEGETNPPVTLQMQANIRTAYSVLHYWSQLPGLKKDGSIDSEHLNNWVRSARLSLSDKGRAPIGDEQIGQILASSPHGEDGIWPCEPVRELIEAIGNVNIDTGVYIGKVNQRGVTSRGIFAGGQQERDLETKYQKMASAIAVTSPRTSRILGRLAENYKSEARVNDAQAERRADD